MVHQGRDVLRQHLRCPYLHTVRRLPVHVLDTLWLLQQATAILGVRALRPPTSAGAGPARFLLAPVPDSTAQRQHPGVRPTAHALVGLEDEQGRVDRHLRMVHSRSGLASQLDVLQALPRTLQARFGSHFHRGGQAPHDVDRLLPLFPATFPGSTTTTKATRCDAIAHRLHASHRVFRGALQGRRGDELRRVSVRFRGLRHVAAAALQPQLSQGVHRQVVEEEQGVPVVLAGHRGRAVS